MTIRDEIRKMIELGPLPAEEEASEEHLKAFEQATDAAEAAVGESGVTREEARALMACFGTTSDSCFGLAWGVLHLIESCPGDVPFDYTADTAPNPWLRRLWDRSHREFDED